MAKLMTINETIKYLQESYGITLSKSTIYKYTSSGKFVSYKLGRAVLLDIDQIVEMICTPRQRGETKDSPSRTKIGDDAYYVPYTSDGFPDKHCVEAYHQSCIMGIVREKILEKTMSLEDIRAEMIEKMKMWGIEDVDKYILTVDEMLRKEGKQ